MKITKLGHCCLIIEDKGVTILTDPGYFTVEQVKAVRGIGVILITHEHADHYHLESVRAALANNPGAAVVANGSMAKLLAEKGIDAIVVGDAQSAVVSGALIEGYGKDHAIIYGTMGQCENTGFFVNGRFYFPGDNLHHPKREVEVLALPITAPWEKLSEAIDFGKRVRPRAAFPVHDGTIVPQYSGFMMDMLQGFLKETGTEFMPLGAGESRAF